MPVNWHHAIILPLLKPYKEALSTYITNFYILQSSNLF